MDLKMLKKSITTKFIVEDPQSVLDEVRDE